MARPSNYSQKIGLSICERMVCGKDDKPESLRSICSDKASPDLKTVMRWLANNEEFRQQYARAREMQQELSHEELLEIADNATDDVRMLLGESEDGALPTINHSAIARARLQIDTRKWVMSKMLPKKYGDSTQVKLADAEGGKLSITWEK